MSAWPKICLSCILAHGLIFFFALDLSCLFYKKKKKSKKKKKLQFWFLSQILSDRNLSYYSTQPRTIHNKSLPVRAATIALCIAPSKAQC